MQPRGSIITLMTINQNIVAKRKDEEINKLAQGLRKGRPGVNPDKPFGAPTLSAKTVNSIRSSLLLYTDEECRTVSKLPGRVEDTQNSYEIVNIVQLDTPVLTGPKPKKQTGRFIMTTMGNDKKIKLGTMSERPEDGTFPDEMLVPGQYEESGENFQQQTNTFDRSQNSNNSRRQGDKSNNLSSRDSIKKQEGEASATVDQDQTDSQRKINSLLKLQKYTTNLNKTSPKKSYDRTGNPKIRRISTFNDHSSKVLQKNPKITKLHNLRSDISQDGSQKSDQLNRQILIQEQEQQQDKSKPATLQQGFNQYLDCIFFNAIDFEISDKVSIAQRKQSVRDPNYQRHKFIKQKPKRRFSAFIVKGDLYKPQHRPSLFKKTQSSFEVENTANRKSHFSYAAHADGSRTNAGSRKNSSTFLQNPSNSLEISGENPHSFTSKSSSSNVLIHPTTTTTSSQSLSINQGQLEISSNNPPYLIRHTSELQKDLLNTSQIEQNKSEYANAIKQQKQQNLSQCSICSQPSSRPPASDTRQNSIKYDPTTQAQENKSTTYFDDGVPSSQVLEQKKVEQVAKAQLSKQRCRQALKFMNQYVSMRKKLHAKDKLNVLHRKMSSYIDVDIDNVPVTNANNPTTDITSAYSCNIPNPKTSTTNVQSNSAKNSVAKLSASALQDPAQVQRKRMMSQIRQKVQTQQSDESINYHPPIRSSQQRKKMSRNSKSGRIPQRKRSSKRVDKQFYSKMANLFQEIVISNSNKNNDSVLQDDDDQDKSRKRSEYSKKLVVDQPEKFRKYSQLLAKQLENVGISKNSLSSASDRYYNEESDSFQSVSLDDDEDDYDQQLSSEDGKQEPVKNDYKIQIVQQDQHPNWVHRDQENQSLIVQSSKTNYSSGSPRRDRVFSDQNKIRSQQSSTHSLQKQTSNDSSGSFSFKLQLKKIDSPNIRKMDKKLSPTSQSSSPKINKSSRFIQMRNMTSPTISQQDKQEVGYASARPKLQTSETDYFYGPAFMGWLQQEASKPSRMTQKLTKIEQSIKNVPSKGKFSPIQQKQKSKFYQTRRDKKKARLSDSKLENLRAYSPLYNQSDFFLRDQIQSSDESQQQVGDKQYFQNILSRSLDYDKRRKSLQYNSVNQSKSGSFSKKNFKLQIFKVEKQENLKQEQEQDEQENFDKLHEQAWSQSFENKLKSKYSKFYDSSKNDSSNILMGEDDDNTSNKKKYQYMQQQQQQQQEEQSKNNREQ